MFADLAGDGHAVVVCVGHIQFKLYKCIYIASVTIKIGALQKPGPDPDSGRKIVLLTGRNLKLGGTPGETISVCLCVYPHIYFSLNVLSLWAN